MKKKPAKKTTKTKSATKLKDIPTKKNPKGGLGDHGGVWKITGP